MLSTHFQPLVRLECVLEAHTVLSSMVIKYKLYNFVHQRRESQRFTELVSKLNRGKRNVSHSLIVDIGSDHLLLRE